MKYNISIFDVFYYNIQQDRLWILRDKNLSHTIVVNHFDHPSFVRLTIAQATHLFNKWNYEFVVYLTAIVDRDQIFDAEKTRGQRSQVVICDNISFCKEPDFFETVSLGGPVNTDEFYKSIRRNNNKTQKSQAYVQGLIAGFGRDCDSLINRYNKRENVVLLH